MEEYQNEGLSDSSSECDLQIEYDNNEEDDDQVNNGNKFKTQSEIKNEELKKQEIKLLQEVPESR